MFKTSRIITNKYLTEIVDYTQNIFNAVQHFKD